MACLIHVSMYMCDSELDDLTTQHTALTLRNASISEYYHIRQQLTACSIKMHDVMMQPVYALPFLNPGRLVHVKDGEVRKMRWDTMR